MIICKKHYINLNRPVLIYKSCKKLIILANGYVSTNELRKMTYFLSSRAN